MFLGFIERLLRRRYAEQEAGASSSPMANDNVASTPKPTMSQDGDQMNAKPDRLYPDIASPPAGGVFPQNNFAPPPPIGRPTPFLPFGPIGVPPTLNPGPLNLNYQANGPFGQHATHPQMNQRPQSEPFATGLGERLLKLVQGNDTNGNSTEQQQNQQQALRNATILDQLNRGVHSVYDNIAKAYNSTVQRQVELLQERLKNSTNGNAWQQRWADQMSSYYKMMAERASKAQHDLNQAWNRFKKTNSSEIEKLQQQNQQPPSPLASFQPFQTGNGESLFPGMARSMNLQNQQMDLPSLNNMSPTQNDVTRPLKDFWNGQIAPHMSQARQMITQTWHEMTANGMMNPMFGRSNQKNPNSTSSNGDFIDGIMRSIDLTGPEYTLVDQNGEPVRGLTDNMQNNMVQMQRELNLLWKGLTLSLEDTLDDIRKSVTNGMGMGMGMGMGHNRNHHRNNKPTQSPIPAESNSTSISTSSPTSNSKPESMNEIATENEISSKLRDINSLQTDADKVYDAVRREQYNQKLQQEQQSMADRIKNFYNNLNIDDNVNKIGSAVNNFWNNIPDNWNNMMNNIRPSSTSTTTKPMQ